MRKPEKLLFEGKIVANLYQFSYETPWASACSEFLDGSLPVKLNNLSKFRAYDLELEEMELPEDEEDVLWEDKLSELGLTHADLRLDKDNAWSVMCNDGKIDDIRSLSFLNGTLKWRA